MTQPLDPYTLRQAAARWPRETLNTRAAQSFLLSLAEDTETLALRDALRIHHPIMRSETGPFSGCSCGAVELGEDVIVHVVTELRNALPRRQP